MNTPTPLSVALGSENQQKLEATQAALTTRFSYCDIMTVEVDSDVSEQPTDIQETVRGARNRAQRARQQTDASLGIGIEGGVTECSAIDESLLIMWITVDDGLTQYEAAGPALPLPPLLAEGITETNELGDVVKEISGTEVNQGAAGVVTNSWVTRTEALTIGIKSAIGQWEQAGTVD